MLVDNRHRVCFCRGAGWQAASSVSALPPYSSTSAHVVQHSFVFPVLLNGIVPLPPPPRPPPIPAIISLPLCACLYLTSTAVMDYLAQPAPASLPADDLSANGNGGGADTGSDHGSDGYFTSDDLLLNDDDDRGSRHTTASSSSHHRRRPFSSGKADGGGGGSGPSAAGQAVAGAALASDYGTWLKRLAVRLRRATPAGERFVRLRCIGPAVTGEQVCAYCVPAGFGFVSGWIFFPILVFGSVPRFVGEPSGARHRN